MGDRGKSAVRQPADLAMLDELIRRYYGRLLQNIEDNPKIGDLIKMIELRRKLAPSGSDQERFWRMMEKIRREALSPAPSKAGQSTPKRPARRRNGV